MDKTKHVSLSLTGLVLSALLSPACLQAGDFSISPLKIELSASAPFSTFEVTNEEENEILLMELELAKWDVLNGTDVFSESNEMLILPPVFRVEPGESQIVRVGLPSTTALTPGTEASYRVVITNIDSEAADPDADSNEDAAGLQMAISVSIPLFVLPNEPVRSARWALRQVSDNTIEIDATNTGNVHLDIRELLLTAPNQDDPVLDEPTVTYLFPEATYTWTFETQTPLNLKGKQATLSAWVNQDDMTLELPVS